MLQPRRLLSALPPLRSRCSLKLLQIVEPVCRRPCVVRSVPWVAVSEVVPNDPRVAAFVSYGETAGVVQHRRRVEPLALVLGSLMAEYRISMLPPLCCGFASLQKYFTKKLPQFDNLRLLSPL